MKRLALAVTLVVPLALGASAAVRARSSTPSDSCPYAAGEARCPWLASHSRLPGAPALSGTDECPARPANAARCPAAGTCPRARPLPGGAGSASTPQHLPLAAGGGVV